MSAIIAAGIGTSYWMFRKGGTWNPIDPFDRELTDFSTPLTSTLPLKPQIWPPQKASMLDTFCTAIRDYEGKPGDLNYQLNNPGDCRPSPVGYLAKYEPVIIIDTDTDPKYPYHIGKFAKFPTFEIGYEYLTNMVHFMAVNHPTWTILDFFAHFAPAGDKNSPTRYATFVATRCSTQVTTQLKDLFV